MFRYAFSLTWVPQELDGQSSVRDHPRACLFSHLAQTLVSCPQLGSAVD